MKTNRTETGTDETNGRIPTSLLRACLNTCSAIRNGIEKAKEKILRHHGELFNGQERLLKVALNEAEAIAWQTDYPHLVFPELAFEKAEAAVSWKRRQAAIQRNQESAFAV